MAGKAERRAVRHVGDGVGLDHGRAIGVPPGLARIAVDLGLRHRRFIEAMQVEPLLDDLVGIAGMHGAVGSAVPHRQLWPGAAMV